MTESKFETVNNVTLHYTLNGTSTGPTLVFLNSLGTDLRIWDAVIPAFADVYQLIRYDKRGHGLSDCPEGPYSIRDHSDDLAALLTHLQVDEAVLIGDSVGGMIALDFAAMYPEQSKALILCDTAAKIGTVDYWNTRINALKEQGLSHLAEAILERWFSPGFAAQHPAAYRGYYNMLTRTPLNGYIATCEAIRDADLRDVVQTLTVQSLVLCGAEDGATPPDLVRTLAEAIPNSQFDLIPQAGHIPSIEQPVVLIEKISQFLTVVVP